MQGVQGLGQLHRNCSVPVRQVTPVSSSDPRVSSLMLSHPINPILVSIVFQLSFVHTSTTTPWIPTRPVLLALEQSEGSPLLRLTLFPHLFYPCWRHLERATYRTPEK